MDELENLLNDALDDLENIDTTVSDLETQELIEHAIKVLTEALNLT